MEGDRREWSYPDLSDGEQIAVLDTEKVELMLNTFNRVHIL